MTLTLIPEQDIDLGFSKGKFWNNYLDWHRMKGKWIETMLDPQYDFDALPTRDIGLGFSRSYFEIAVFSEMDKEMIVKV